MMQTGIEGDAARDLRDRLARIEGQIRGLSKMIDERRPCDEVLVQIMAARAALEKIAAAVVSDSIDSCLALPPDKAREVIGRSISMLTKV
jgi:DNA-binding FrmR family transcriptional regulator